MNMKFVRTWAMLALVMVIGLSVTGGTIAWFTDSVSSTNNIIQSGTLDIQLLEGETEVTADTQLFNYTKWEPGYVALKKLTIKNNGTLALKYTFGINPDSIPEDAKLAEVIDVYSFPAGTEVTRAAVNAATPVGSLKELSAEGNTKVVSTGNLTQGQTEDVILVLKMRESAGNEYQNLTLSNVGISLLATQYTYEKDAFDDQYDANATYDGTVNNPDDPDDNLPQATVTELSFTTLPEIWNYNGETKKIDKAYSFVAQDDETTVQESEYKDWNADFVISFDKDVDANTIGLLGQYDEAFGETWLAFELNNDLIGKVNQANGIDNDTTLAAGTPIRLLDSAMMLTGQTDYYFSYEAICTTVKEFNCGAFAITDAANGTKINVQLRLYEVDADLNETGESVLVNEFDYTFGA